jgi:hypothetical protein
LSLDFDRQASKLDAERTNLNVQFDRPNGETVESSTRTAVVVLGMHRSGTSSVAGALVRLGGAAPRNLLPPQLDNPRGFWESSVLVTLNDDILAAGGSDWQDWRAFDPARIDPPARLALHARARSALADEFGDASLPIVKDPRMCRLMPFWSSVFHEADWSIRPLLQLRSPLEVALSLNRRDGVALSLGCLIWLRHVLDAEAESREMRRAVLNWNDFLDDRRRTLERVGEQLGLTWPGWSASALAEIDEFVSADLRRQKASEDDLRVHPAVSDLVRETYAAMIRLLEDPTNSRAKSALDDVRTRFEDAAALFGQAMFETEEESRRLESLAKHEREERASQLDALQHGLGAQFAAARHEFASQLAAERDNFAGQLNAVRNEFARQLAADRGENTTLLAEREARLAEKDLLIVEKNRLIAAQEREIGRAAAALADREREAAKTKVDMEEARAALASSEREAAERIARLNEDRDFLARYLSRTFRRPWRPIKFFLSYNLLRSFSMLAAPFSHRMAARFKLSALKRGPSRFNLYLHERANPSQSIALTPGCVENPSSTEPVPPAPQASVAADPVEPPPVPPPWATFFDENWYLERYPDVAAKAHELGPLEHFVQQGAAEGRDPNPAFHSTWYLSTYPDVAQGGLIAIDHFVEWGAAEGRPPFKDFNYDLYRQQASLPQASNLEAYRHYLIQGRAAGLHASSAPSFAELLRNQYLSLEPLRVYEAPHLGPRVTMVTDSINKGSLYGGVATAIILAALLARRLGGDLRLVTRTEPADATAIGMILRTHGVYWTGNVECLYSPPGLGGRDIPIDREDFFVTTSWWTTRATRSAVPPRRIVYMLGEDERLFYPAGDDHLLCAETLSDPEIFYAVNSNILFDHLQANGLAPGGVAFEPAFSSVAYYPEKRPLTNEKRQFFFYGRPNNLRNLYWRGVSAIAAAIEEGVFEPGEWDFCFLGKDMTEMLLPRGVRPRIMNDASRDEYLKLVRHVDVGLSLIYTPHPSYPPFDLAASGAVVVTNRFGSSKVDLSRYSPNILCVEPTLPGLVAGLRSAVALAGNHDVRFSNVTRFAMPRDWETALTPVADHVADRFLKR